MECNVTFRHMKATDPLVDHARAQVERLEKLLSKPAEVQATLSLDKHLHVAHIELVLDGAQRIRSTERSGDMYASIDMAVSKLERQLKRYRDKLRARPRGESSVGRELAHKVLRLPEETAVNIHVPEIVHEEKIVVHEMNVDDAVMQMDLQERDFLVFTNSVSREVNVVYRRPDGQYGLIEAHAA